MSTQFAETVETAGLDGFDFAMLLSIGTEDARQLYFDLQDCGQRYLKLKEAYKQDRLADLEKQYDEAVLNARSVRGNAETFKQSTFRARQEMVEAENAVRRADSALNNLHLSIRADRSLKTSAEVVEQEKQVEAAKQAAHAAQYGYGTATHNYNNACRMEQESDAAAQQAESIARNLKQQIDMARGKRVYGQGLQIA